MERWSAGLHVAHRSPPGKHVLKEREFSHQAFSGHAISCSTLHGYICIFFQLMLPFLFPLSGLLMKIKYVQFRSSCGAGNQSTVCFPRALVVAAVQQCTGEDAAVCRFECHPQPNSELGAGCAA